MKYLSSKEAQNNFGALLDTAQKMPVIIQKHKRDFAAVISMKDYDLLRKVRLQELKKLCNDVGKKAKEKGLTPEILEKLLQ